MTTRRRPPPVYLDARDLADRWRCGGISPEAIQSRMVESPPPILAPEKRKRLWRTADVEAAWETTHVWPEGAWGR